MKFKVTVDYQTANGGGSKAFHVEADSEAQAITLANHECRKNYHVLKIVGGDVTPIVEKPVLSAPAKDASDLEIIRLVFPDTPAPVD